MEKTVKRVIPFGKAARVGNYKLWRGKYVMKTSDGETSVECVHVSNLDGSWSVRIPETYEMFGILMSLYDDATDELNVALSAQAASVMETVMGNMMYVSVIGNGYYHRALELVATLYANPLLLAEDNRKGLAEEAESLIGDFLQWRKEYDERVARMQPTEADDHRDDLADEASAILNEEGGEDFQKAVSDNVKQ